MIWLIRLRTARIVLFGLETHRCRFSIGLVQEKREVYAMAGTKDEMLGGVKQGLGKLTGDEALEAEGTIQKHGGRAERKTSGAAREMKGSMKKAAGKLLDSPTLKAEGEAEQTRGRIERS
jgi:uncharacterized protein YjbJ (UPF0337 family)